MKKVVASITGIAVVAGIGAMVTHRLMASAGPISARAAGPAAVAVEVAAVERGPIEDRRVFSGTLDATSRVVVTPKVGGRVVSLPLEIADSITHGQVLAKLDDGEFRQDVLQAEADVAVAQAGVVEARSAAEISRRDLERARELHGHGDVSEAELDLAAAAQVAQDAAVETALARVQRAEAALAASRLRLADTEIRVDWDLGAGMWVVAERFAEMGGTATTGTPLLSLVELDPIEAVLFVTERDYGLFAAGQAVRLSTDAYPGKSWEGRVARIAPIFEEGSRQSRVEIRVENPGGALKPGMFARIEVVLRREEDAVIVPVEALTQRDGGPVVFVVPEGASTVTMVPVTVGVREGSRVQVIGDGVAGRVVTLGQQLLGPGTGVRLVDAPTSGGAASR